jgi:hypothetical protein
MNMPKYAKDAICGFCMFYTFFNSQEKPTLVEILLKGPGLKKNYEWVFSLGLDIVFIFPYI